MIKKQLLIVAHHLTIGGVQKSLISALKAIDYDKYEVTLYLRKNRLDLLPFVDERVKVIANTDPHHYYRKPYALLYQSIMLLGKMFKKDGLVEKYNNKLSNRIRKDMMEYERNMYFSDKKYDIAISYVQGYTTIFVSDYVSADKKIVFYQVSVDELHDVHKYTLPKYDLIVVEHDDVKKLFSQWYPQEKNKITVLENYVDYKLIRKLGEESADELEKDDLVLCSCGRLSKVKGFDLAVEAAKILRDKNVNFKWYFIGDGPERANIERLIKEYGLDNNVILLGMQKNPYKYIAACDIYIQPSYEEAISMAIMETQILCVPIISTKTVGGLSMIQNGIDGMVANIDPESLADSIFKLAQDDNLKDMFISKLKQIDYTQKELFYNQQWSELLLK